MEHRSRSKATCQLPPLILHPFSDASGPTKLLRSSRANLALQGIIPSSDEDEAELERTLLEGRYCEVRMLCYVGKDVNRWIQQCLELVSRDDRFHDLHLEFGSFANLLIEETPAGVKEKLYRWGVVDYPAIFRRGLGLNAMFTDMPSQEILHSEFLLHYHLYADNLFKARSSRTVYPSADPDIFEFDLYASGEYARMLERSWQD